MTRLPAGLLVVLTVAAAPAAAGFREAVEAYEEGDFETAVRELRPLAESGEIEAQFYLAYLYETGRGVEPDDAASADWYRKAAEQGHDRAQFNLGLAYEQGRGVAEDPALALEWYVKASNQGFARAQYKAAEMYLAGTGTRKDLLLAYQWFKLAGNQRYEDARRRRKQIAKDMTPYQIAEADMRVRIWNEAHER